MLSSLLKKQERKRKVYNIADARRVGIIYEVKDEAEIGHIHYFVDYLHDQGKHVKALGYVESKEIMGFLKHTTVYSYFQRAELNWYFKPVSPDADNFAEEEFDILIDLSEEDKLPMQFVIAASKARFKAGKYQEEKQDLYDMMISVGDNTTLKYLIGQMRHYLTIINKPLNEAV